MNHHRIHRFWRSAAQCLLGSAVLALLTFVCFRWQVNSTTVALLYLIVIVMVALTGGLIPSALVSIIAYVSLDSFFTEPLFHIAMQEPRDVVAPIAFLTTALVIESNPESARRKFRGASLATNARPTWQPYP